MRYTDVNKFNSSYQYYFQLADKAVFIFTDPDLNEMQRFNDLKEIGRVEWESAEEVAIEMQSYNVNNEMKEKAENLASYARLRLKEIEIIGETGIKTEGNPRLKDIREKLRSAEKKIR